MQINEKIIGIFFFIGCLFTLIAGYIGIYSYFKDNTFIAHIFGLLFLIVNGYVYLRAYTAVIEDPDNKKQP